MDVSVRTLGILAPRLRPGSPARHLAGLSGTQPSPVIGERKHLTSNARNPIRGLRTRGLAGKVSSDNGEDRQRRVDNVVGT